MRIITVTIDKTKSELELTPIGMILSGGVEIISRVIAETESQYLLNKPMIVMLSERNETIFAKYSAFSKSETVIVPKLAVVSIMEPKDAFVEYYESMKEIFYDPEKEEMFNEEIRNTNKSLIDFIAEQKKENSKETSKTNPINNVLKFPKSNNEETK